MPQEEFNTISKLDEINIKVKTICFEFEEVINNQQRFELGIYENVQLIGWGGGRGGAGSQ